MSSPSANLNSEMCFKAICLVKIMKRSPQVSTKSSSVSRELQSIKTAGRAFSEEGRGATGCSSSNSKGTQIKRHSLYYYSLQKRRELWFCWQTTAVKEPQLCCHWSTYNTEISADIFHKGLSPCSSCSVPRPGADATLPMVMINFLPPGESNPVFNTTKHSDCSSISNPVSSHHRFLPCSYSHPPNPAVS